MTATPGWGLPAPRAVTAPPHDAPTHVHARRATLEWSPPGPVARPVEVPAPAPARGGRRPGRAVARHLVPALVAAVVSGATVAVLTTVGPFADRADTRPAAEEAKAAPVRIDTGWQPLAVSGGFVVTGDGARYRVVDGVCYLQVHLRDPDGLWSANAPIAVLPASARPAWNHDFTASRDGVPYSEVGVYDDGSVLMTRPGDGVVGHLTFTASFPVGD